MEEDKTLGHKDCSKCHLTLALEDFSKSHRGVLGRKPACKKCNNALEAVRRRKQGAKEYKPVEREFRGDDEYKRCIKCASFRGVLDGYHRNKSSGDGLSATCKICTIELKRNYYYSNRDYLVEYSSQYYKDHREEVLRKSKIYQESNPHIRKAYYIKNREHLIQYSKEYVERNRVKVNESARLYRQANKEKVNNDVRIWNKKNKHKAKMYKLRRQAKLDILVSDITEEQTTSILKRFGNRCALSMVQEDIHLDHVIPVSIGRGGTTYGNIIPLSNSLNSSKRDKNIFEWFGDNKERFKLTQTAFDDLIRHLAEVNDMTINEYRDYVDWCFSNKILTCERKAVIK